MLSELLWIILPCAIVPGLLALLITWRVRPTVTAAVPGGMLAPALLFAVIAYQQHRASAQKDIDFSVERTASGDIADYREQHGSKGNDHRPDRGGNQGLARGPGSQQRRRPDDPLIYLCESSHLQVGYTLQPGL